ncbi:hypothetical protein FQZ97_1178820 [compost metagenome]
MPDGIKAEGAVDALDQLALRMRQKKGTRALAGNGEDARLMPTLAGNFGGAARPGDFFRPGAVGEISAGNFVPGAEQHGVDAGALGQHRIDEVVGHFADLDDAAALAAPGRLAGIHVSAPDRENIPVPAKNRLEDRRLLRQL